MLAIWGPCVSEKTGSKRVTLLDGMVGVAYHGEVSQGELFLELSTSEHSELQDLMKKFSNQKKRR